MKTPRNLLRHGVRLGVIVPFAALLCGPSPASASPILGSDLSSFTVLGGSAVTNVPTSTIVGNVGVSPGTSITGFNTSPGVAVSDPQVTGGLVHTTTPVAASAEAQLGIAIANLGSLGSGTTLSLPDLAGLTLAPGVYTVPAGTTNLSGTLILNGGGNANAAWVFQLPSTLITSPNSVVNVINTGSGAGVFWDVGSSATIDTNTAFLGNILALTAITLNTTASDLCGRALAENAAVTLDDNSLSGTCSGILTDSLGLSGGLDVTTLPGGGTEVGFLPFVPISTTAVPEPGTFLLFGFGLTALFAFRKKFSAAA